MIDGLKCMSKARLRVFKHFAQELSTLSKCEDKHVACVITDTAGTKVYSIGINGGPRGGRQCLCSVPGKYTCVHAEANALAKCTTEDPNKVVISTFSPCVTCAALMINSGVSAVYYIDEYKDTLPLDMLRDAGIRVMKLESDDVIYRDNMHYRFEVNDHD